MIAVAFMLAAFVGGWLGVVAFALQSAIAVLLLEMINYIEHYGLQRREAEPGRYERVQPQHSWNASHRVTNWYLFNLQRHSDHHFAESRRYWELRHHEDVPQLPFSYPTALLTSLVPPLWRRIMDPRVDAWNARAAAHESVSA
jgi:alkane 1-monooxygenase